jgi:hypothetical protein
LQLFRLSKNYKSYSELPIYQKLENFVFAQELIESIIEIVQKVDRDNALAEEEGENGDGEI